MARRISPRHLLLTTIVATVVIAVLCGVFYVQYRGLANSIIDSGVSQHESSVLAAFQLDAEQTLDLLGNELVLAGGNAKSTLIANALSANERLVAVRFEPVDAKEYQRIRAAVATGEYRVSCERVAVT